VPKSALSDWCSIISIFKHKSLHPSTSRKHRKNLHRLSFLSACKRLQSFAIV
jgi:hypothetical protein